MAKKKSTVVYLVKANIGDRNENLIYGIIVFNGDEKTVYINKCKLDALKILLSESKFKIIEYINQFIDSEKLNSNDLYCIDKHGFIELIRFNMNGFYEAEEAIKMYNK